MNIGIVNDLPLAVEAMRRTIALRGEHRVLWVATDGAQAVDCCIAQPPDVVLMDLIMPKFDGVEATRRIMARAPCAILVVTSSVGANAWRVYEAMGAGALDAVDTPTLGDNRLGDASQPLLAKIDQIGRLLGKPLVYRQRPGTSLRRDSLPFVAIGASAGGPTALATVLGKLPADFGAPIVIVQHVDQAFAHGMAEWLDGQSALTVRVVLDGDRPQAGEALMAATNDHLRLTRGGSLGYTREPADMPYRPSVDVFSQHGRALARRCDRRAADRHGPGWRDRPESDAREGIPDHRAGRSDERGLRHAESRGRARRGTIDPPAREHCRRAGSDRQTVRTT